MNISSRDSYRLFWLTALISGLGLVLLSSSSMTIAEKLTNNPWYFFQKQIVSLLLGYVCIWLLSYVNMSTLYQNRHILLMFAILGLLLLFVPGVGSKVKGSTRWIDLYIIKLQVAEFVKLIFLIFLAGYLADHDLKSGPLAALKPLLVLCVLSILFLLQPDFGAVVLLSIVSIIMLFLSRIHLFLVISAIIVATTLLTLIAVFSPYRLTRLMVFLDPWSTQFTTGYQLTQSLIAFGNGGIWGNGLGNSIQKLLYLPEAHTDFVFAVIAEETGVAGLIFVTTLFLALFSQIVHISMLAFNKGQAFNGYLACGIAILLLTQYVISFGVNCGVLPTKGLTVPLISYGGSSILSYMCAIGFVNRIGKELWLTS